MKRRMFILIASVTVAAAIVFTGWKRLSANAPDGRFVDVSDGLQDQVTGLVWQKSDNGTTYTMANAITTCTGLGGAWRLPRVDELLTIADPRAVNPALDPAFTFSSTGGYIFWTSTYGSCSGQGAGIAYAVDFSNGSSTQVSDTVTYRARCVR